MKLKFLINKTKMAAAVNSEWRIFRFAQKITNGYVLTLINYPIVVLISVAALSIILTVLGAKYGTGPDFSDPTVGFETQGTDLSGRVVSWRVLNGYQMSVYPKKDHNYFRKLSRVVHKRSVLSNSSGIEDDPFEANFFASMMTQGPCLQLKYPFKEAKYFCQAVFELQSSDHAFSEQVVKQLCSAQDSLNSTFDSIRPAIPYPEFWSWSNYMVCLAGQVSCSEISQADLHQRHEDLKICWPHRHHVLDCYNPETHGDNYDAVCVDKLPGVCQTKYYFDLFYFVLPKDFLNPDGSSHGGRVYVNTILPILQLPAFEHQRTPGVTFAKFKKLYGDVIRLDLDSKWVRFRGLNLGIKMALYGDYLLGDSKYVVISACVATLLCLAYSGSLFYGGCVALSLFFSLGISFFIYSVVLQIHFFPFINLLVIVLLVGIGADNTFVLKHIFDHSIETNRRKLDEGSETEPSSEHSFQTAVKNAAKSMFVTNATTAAAFYANSVSDVVVMKCFGLFAGTTMLVNYFLIATFLPASLIVLERHIQPKLPALLRMASWRHKIFQLSELLARKVFYSMVNWFKFAWFFLFSALFITSCFIVFYKPGLKLPEKNPILLFKKDNPMEWYDEYAGDYFHIANTNQNDPLVVELVWGLNVDSRGHPLESSNHYVDQAQMVQDPQFHLDFKKLKILSQTWARLANSSLVRWKNDFRTPFYEQYLAWSANQTCGNRVVVCCNYLAGQYSPMNFSACLLQSSRDLDVLNEGPIFDSHRNTVAGYTMRFTSLYNFSLMHKDLDRFYKFVDQTLQSTIEDQDPQHEVSRSWWTTENYFALLWFDLQQSLLRGTPISIAVSVLLALVVVVVSTQTLVLSLLSILTIAGVMVTTIAALVLLDWRLNVVESTIIILTAGLSFDFTLLYAAAYKLSAGATRQERVTNAFRFIGCPVLLSAVTTCAAGLCMLPTVTMAYFQIGVFMIVVTAVSYLASTFFFMSLLMFFGSPSERLKKCQDIDLY